MATHSSILAWKIPWKEEPGRLQSMGSQRIWHNWATSLSLSTCVRGAEKQIWVFLKLAWSKTGVQGTLSTGWTDTVEMKGWELQGTGSQGLSPSFWFCSATWLSSLLEGGKCPPPHCSLVGLPWTPGLALRLLVSGCHKWWDPTVRSRPSCPGVQDLGRSNQ